MDTIDEIIKLIHAADIPPEDKERYTDALKPRDIDARPAKDQSQRYKLGHANFAYTQYNSLNARSTDDSASEQWTQHFILEDMLAGTKTDADDPEETQALHQSLRDVKYAIAATDFLEEVAALFYHNDVLRLPYGRLRSKVTDIRRNMLYAKKGGRFRRGSNTPPTHYKDL